MISWNVFSKHGNLTFSCEIPFFIILSYLARWKLCTYEEVDLSTPTSNLAKISKELHSVGNGTPSASFWTIFEEES